LRKAISLACAALVGVTGATLCAGAASAQQAPTTSTRDSATHAVFVQTNSTAGNSIRVFTRAADGTLTPAGEYPTGGMGGTEQQAPLDALASQGSLVYANGMLFAVNAGSDTITAFHVNGTTLTDAQVIGSGGSFPVSIAVYGNLVYVLNAGGDGSVQAFVLDDGILTAIPGDNRSLGLGNAVPPVHISAPAQVIVSPDGRYVLVPTKNHDTVDVFQSYGGWLSDQPVASPSANPVPFAGVFDPNGDLLLTEAGTSTVTAYRLNPDATLTALGSSESNGQAALCWIQEIYPYYFGANAGSADLSKFQLGPGDLPKVTNPTVTETDAGPIDMAASDGYLYVQNSVAGTVTGYAMNWFNGVPFLITRVSGLPKYNTGGMEGIAAS